MKVWWCSHCGPSPSNRSNWCDLGCGRDYQQMFEAPVADRPLTESEYEPIRFALFEHRNGSATEARRRVADHLAAAGLTLVPVADLENLQRAWNASGGARGPLGRA